jgi:dTDP-L-rhamnose 4-epimerase
MKILVTGGAGFIGSHLVEELAGQGNDVRVLDSMDPQAHSGGKPSLPRNVELLKGNVKSVSDWTKALEGVEAVYHLAAAVGISQSMHRPSHFLETNTVGTANLYEAALQSPEIRKGLKRIVIPSSKTIYGEGTYKCKDCGIVYPPMREKAQLQNKDWEMRCPGCGKHTEPVGTREGKPPNPISVYALSKYDTENLALNFSYALGISTLVFRGFSVYGPGQSLSNPYSGVCSIFLSRIKNGQPPVIFEDGGQMRDYIYIDDVTRFLLKSLDSRVEGAFNLGTGKPTSVKEIADILLEETGSDIEQKVTGEFRVGDNRHDFADMALTGKKLGFAPKWGIRKGLGKLVEWGETSEAKDMFDESERVRKMHFG